MVPTASRTAAPPARCRDQSYGAVSIVLEHQGTEFDDMEAMRRAVKHLRNLLRAG